MGCEICNQNKVIDEKGQVHTNDWRLLYTGNIDQYSEINGNTLTVHGVVGGAYENYDSEEEVKINYCPFCGTKINGSEKL
ncbi:hypothetical protein [Enterococcus gallinarum]|uniref:hypothetical protein n=1 Tax=Enterococcus gallinarum TaxID=1353 RepID=UPI0012E1DE7F|nr:hypothetical protein [Enterococcus gallinarum]MUO32854.1 hypothetical protein [Enterococcus gallinarum]